MQLINSTGLNVGGTSVLSGLTYPTSDGSAGQYLQTDGSGTLSFSTVSGYTDSDVETYLNTSEIYTDATNDRLGIGDSSPAAKLTLKAGDNTYAGGFRIEGVDETTALAITHVNGDNYFSGNATDDHLVLTGTGNVGIGTSSPTALSGYSTIALNGTNGGLLEFKKGDTQMSYIANAGDPVLQFVTNGAEAMRITSTGEIVTGGLTSSTGQLHLYKADATGGKLVLQSQVASDATAKITMMSRLLDNTNKDAYIEAYRGNINFGGDAGYGKVGIGDNEPPSLLTVTGANTGFVASNGAGISGIQVSRTTTSGENLYMYTSSGAGWSGSSAVGRIESYGNNAMEIGSQQNAPISFGTNNIERMRIDGDGTFNATTRQYYMATYGEHHIRTGGAHGTGTFTLFTNGGTTTQSAGLVEVWGIYSTPSAAGYRMYIISGNRNIGTAIAYTQTGGTVPQPTLAWNGADLQISNSNSSLYYHVRVTLHDIGNTWSATWGNLPGIS
jgi:hypothetical protein